MVSNNNTTHIGLKIASFGFWLWLIVTFVSAPRFGLLPSAKSINVCVWSGMFDLKWVAQFEKNTGIRVNLSYYDSNEELLVKLHTHKEHGYDLIVPSDYTIPILQKSGMLKKIDKSKLTFYYHLNPLLLGHYFDEHNKYSVPFEWAVYGLGINKERYNDVPEETWGLIFDSRLIGSHKIMMSNDPLIAIPLASLYLNKSIDIKSSKVLCSIECLLHKQHPLVEAYTDLRASYYLASKNADIAVCSSSSMFKAMREYKELAFIVPKEGSIITIESFAIPSTSTKDDLVYAFLNFIMKPESVMHSYEHLGFFPATTDVLENTQFEPQVRQLLTMTKQEFSHFQFLRFDKLKKVLSPSELQQLWVRIKSFC